MTLGPGERLMSQPLLEACVCLCGWTSGGGSDGPEQGLQPALYGLLSAERETGCGVPCAFFLSGTAGGLHLGPTPGGT